MLTLQQIDLQYGQHVLFESANFTLYAGQKYGLVGRNGRGKSTLLSLIQGNIAPDRGEVIIQGNPLIASIEQEINDLQRCAIDHVIAGDPTIGNLWLQMKTLSEQQIDSDALAQMHVTLAEHRAYDIEATAAKILIGLGFDQAQLYEPIASFSGGWRVRLNLARCLIQPADLLLLDEPTNHLDLDAVIWLEDWLKTFNGALIVIAHDRYFLDRVTQHTLVIEHQQLTPYRGNYSQYEQVHHLQADHAQKKQEKQQKARAHIEQFVNRFRAQANKAKQVQSRIKQLEKMEKIAAVQQESPYQVEFLQPPALVNPVLTMKDVTFSYQPGCPILSKVQFNLQIADRIGLLGLNGAGKSTFIKLLAGVQQPDHGLVEYCNHAQIGYFSQHQMDQLHLDQHALWHLKQYAPNVSESQLRTYLGRFQFQSDKVFQHVKTFSGGEKARLALALIIWQRPNILLLDEPTNHLDMAMREALAYALQSYEGVLVLISHDRYLLEACVDQFYLVSHGQVQLFEGDLSDYAQWSKQQRTETKSYHQSTDLKQHQDTSSKKKGQQHRTLKKQIQTIERQINKKQTQLKQLDATMTEVAIDDYEQLDQLTQQRADLSGEIEALEHDWLMYQEACDDLTT